MRAAAALAALLLAGCQQQATNVDPATQVGAGELVVYQPEFGPNAVFREATAAAPGHELIVTDLFLPPEAVGATHFHPWEEYLYILGGTAVLDIEGEKPQELDPGDAVIIPREAVHTPAAGPDGVRAMVIRVHDDGDPERVLVEEVEAE